MINEDGTLYVTVALDRRSDGIGILVPGYANRVIVRADPQADSGHRLLHVALDSLLGKDVAPAQE